MFLSNKYSRWYDAIISQARSQCKPAIAERHHIIPKSMGGNDQESNLVYLTPRAHFICHLLLSKMTEGNAKYKMTTAICLMKHNTSKKLARIKITSKIYDMSVMFSRVSFSEEHRAKLSFKAKNRKSKPMSESARINHRESMIGKNKGKKLSDESKNKISISKTGVLLGPTSQETKNKISKANTGKIRSQTMKENQGKRWEIQDPNGSRIIIKSLKTFCKDRSLGYTSLMNTLLTKKPIINGQSRGWLILSKLS